jgi:hypothetical protein
MTLKNDLGHIYKILIRKDPKNKLFGSVESSGVLFRCWKTVGSFIFPKQHDYLEMKLYNFVKHPCLEGLEGS